MRCATAALAMLALAAGSARATDPKDDPSRIGRREIGRCINLYSAQKEIALGKQLAEEVARESKLDQDPLVSEFVNRLGQNLVRNSDAKLPFVFRVVQDSSPNAFALPGGFVFVNTGLIELASDESELAAAMAHEIAHVAARHMTCEATRERIVGAVLNAGLGGYARQAAALGASAAFLSFTRAAETEADYLGTQYLYAAGYDPTAEVSLFEKLESLRRKEPGTWGRIFSTHPMDADRLAKTQKEIDRILPPRPQYIVTTSEYRDIRERVINRGLDTGAAAAKRRQR